MLLVLVFAGVLLFVCGVAFLFKGYMNIPASDSIVPIADFDKVRKDLESAKTEGNTLKKQLDTLAIELEQTRVKLQEAQKSKEVVKQLQLLDEQTKLKIAELDERIGAFMAKADQQAKEAVDVINALTQENETLRAQTAAQSTQAAASEADQQAAETVKTEKEGLAKNVEELTAKIQQLETDLAASKTLQDDMATAKAELEKLTQENQKLEEGAASAPVAAPAAEKPAEPSAEANELAQAKQTIEQLQKDLAAAQAAAKAPEEKAAAAPAETNPEALKQVESLQAQVSQKETRIQELEKELRVSQEEVQKANKAADDLKAQLQAKVESAPAAAGSGSGRANPDVIRLEEEISRLRQEKARDDASRSLEREMELKRLCSDLKLQLDTMGRTVDDLKKENRSLQDRQRNLESPRSAPSGQESAARNLLADIQRGEAKVSGHEPWSQEKKQLELHLRQLKDFNTHLLEKEKMIQTELTKSRTQAKGLEKICEEFKKQLEKTGVHK